MVRIPRAALALLIASLALAAGCGGDDEPSAGASGAAAETAGPSTPASCQEKGVISEKEWNQGAKKLPDPADPAALKGKRIAFIGFGQDNVWSQWLFKSVTCEAERWGAEAKFIGPPKFDAQAQFQLASDLSVSKNYDGLVIVPNDSTSIAPALKQVVAADIPVVSVLQPAGPDVLAMKNQIPGMTGNVIEDLTVNAQAMADGVIDACAEKAPCNVIVVWGARVLAFDKVKPKIFQARLEGHDNIKIVCETDGGYDQEVGRTATADCLQAHPDVDVLASQADQQTRGSERALKAAGKTFGMGEDDVKIVSAYGTMHGDLPGPRGQVVPDELQPGAGAGSRRHPLGAAEDGGQPGRSGAVLHRPGQGHRQGAEPPDTDALKEHPEVVGQWDG